MLTPEQMEERRHYFGASECASALGYSKWFTPLQLYLSKIGQGEPIEETIPMMIGTQIEPLTIAMFERDTDQPVIDRQRVFYDPGWSVRRATVDGMLEDGDIIEAKSSGSWADWGTSEDEIPTNYLINIHHTFICCPEAKRAWFPVILGQREFRIYTVQRDDDLVQIVREEGRRFWDDYVDARVPPPPKTHDDIALLYPKDSGGEIEATSEIIETWAKWSEARETLKAAEAKVDEYSLKIKAYMAECNTLRVSLVAQANVLATFNTSNRTTVDIKKMRKDHQEIVLQYESIAPQRRLLHKGPKGEMTW